MIRKHERREFVSSALGWGFVIGLLAGGIGALFRPVRFHVNREQLEFAGQNLRDRVGSIIPRDSIAESIAEGKAAAHRRRTELRVNR